MLILLKKLPILFILLWLTAACGGNTDTTTVEPTATTAVEQPAAVTDPATPAAVTQVTLTPTPQTTAHPAQPSTEAVNTPVPAMPLPTPPNPLLDYYVVQSGDTLGGISLAYDISLDDLIALNGLPGDNAIIQVGQTLQVPLEVNRTTPVRMLLPDSEVVYSPAYVEFDTAAFIESQGGYLANYSERVDGNILTAAQIVDRVANRFSVGPRPLLATLEYYGEWVTNPEPSLIAQPLGAANPYGDNLYLQLGWTANRLNQGYYGYKQLGALAIRFRDGTRAIAPAGLNAGTAAIYNLLAQHTSRDNWPTDIAADGWPATYHALFGEPAQYAIEPLIPATLTQPPMQLPWQPGVTFYLTGGPHAAYGDGSGWSALDFGPPDVLGSCYYSAEPLTAALAGHITLDATGVVYLDADGDGLPQTGWNLLYLHTVADDTLQDGQMVQTGAVIGYASCEGGQSNASHLHLARRYNGEWLAAAGPVPFDLSGWVAQNGLGQYDGGLRRGDDEKEACECWDDELNALVGE